jgi:aspartate oxidase
VLCCGKDYFRHGDNADEEEGHKSNRVSVAKMRVGPTVFQQLEMATRRKIKLSMAMRRKVLARDEVTRERSQHAGVSDSEGNGIKFDISGGIGNEAILQDSIPVS